VLRHASVVATTVIFMAVAPSSISLGLPNDFNRIACDPAPLLGDKLPLALWPGLARRSDSATHSRNFHPEQGLQTRRNGVFYFLNSGILIYNRALATVLL